MSDIEWTEKTWNPLGGCKRVSEGCRNCYAEVMAKRLAAMGQKPYEGLVDKRGHWTGKIRLFEHKLDEPLKRKKPTVYFVNSMSDLFHEDVPLDYIQRVFEVMNCCPQHTFQVLTKRPELALLYSGDLLWTENIWMGTSVEDDKVVERIDHLRMIPAKLRFLSLEPLLGKITDSFHGIHWVIIGGESGPKARECDVHEVYNIVHRCKSGVFRVPVFVKQLGRRPVLDGKPMRLKSIKGGDMSEWPQCLRVREMPKVTP